MALTSEQLVSYIQARRAAGDSLKTIGDRLGVTHVAVHRWLQGHKPSNTVLLLAEKLWSEPAV